MLRPFLPAPEQHAPIHGKTSAEMGPFLLGRRKIERVGRHRHSGGKEEQDRKRARDIAAIDGRETEALTDLPGLFMAE